MAEAATSFVSRFASNNTAKPHFSLHLHQVDPEITEANQKEWVRQQDGIELIASENYASQAVIDALGMPTTNKYAEGYPAGKKVGKKGRYYGGCEHVDTIELLAIDRACQLFNCTYANVQPHSGSQANQAVYEALLEPGEKIMGLKLSDGGHLTHGALVSSSGKIYKSVPYGVDQKTGLLDYNELQKQVSQEKPKILVAGASAYSRVINYRKFREIADSVGAILMVDMAHYAGLIAQGEYKPSEPLKEGESLDDFNPMKWAQVVTTTTHKTLRGPRGGMILSNNPELEVEVTVKDAEGKPGKKKMSLAEALDSSVFPNLQGGPLMNTIAGKAVALKEALAPEFKDYARQVVENARVLASTLQKSGIDIVTGGTDTHLMLMDLRSRKVPGKFRKDGVTPDHLSGKAVEAALERAGLTTNKNTIPGEPNSPFVTSGVRLGTPAGTTRGFGTEEFRQIGDWIAEIVNTMAAGKDTAEIETRIKDDVKKMCARFPIYDDPIQQIRKNTAAVAI